MSLNIPGLFVTGTDTGVGKTFVTAMIAGQLREEGLIVGAYKPACSGAVETPGGPVWDD
ncbi:MAG TPA: dethiobiotin synthase, partial [Planctomycetaceae bacterium]